MKIGLFGGTFDPVHRGHLALAYAAAEAFSLELIYFVPAAQPPHKKNRTLTDFHHRFAMLALATADDERFVPSLLEADSAEPNYSIQTVQRVKKTLAKADQLYFLTGIDSFKEINSWKQAEQLLAECDFVVASRPGYSLGDVAEALPQSLRPAPAEIEALRKQQAGGTVLLHGTTVHLLSGVEENVSSTQIRAAATESMRLLSRYVPEPVARYIKKQHLYVSPAAQKNRSTKDNKVLSFRRVDHKK